MTKARLIVAGGAGSVTGANFLLETGSSQLLVDCGLEQGLDSAELHNYEDFTYNPAEIAVLLVTHAHADHIGRIPKLYRDGFRGRVISTAATRDLAEIMYTDSVGLVARDAKERGLPVLYEEQDVTGALALWETVDYYEEFSLPDEVTAVFLDAGHILGSAMIKLSRGGKQLVFTGDLGNSPSPLLRDTDSIAGTDYLVMESVYGNRNHEHLEDREPRFKQMLKEALARGGTVVLASFSMERTQVFLYELNQMIEGGELPRVPVYLDSPLAIKLTEVYKKYVPLYKKEVQVEAMADDLFSFPGLLLTETRDESKEINEVAGPKLIIAGAGMSEGGRVIHHEARYLGDPHSTIILGGYQAVGTLGRRLLEGNKSVEIFGKTIKIRAKIEQVSGFSAHKQRDDLVEFVAETAETLKEVIVAMGEPSASEFLAQRLHDYLGVKGVVPGRGQEFEFEW